MSSNLKNVVVICQKKYGTCIMRFHDSWALKFQATCMKANTNKYMVLRVIIYCLTKDSRSSQEDQLLEITVYDSVLRGDGLVSKRRESPTVSREKKCILKEDVNLPYLWSISTLLYIADLSLTDITHSGSVNSWGLDPYWGLKSSACPCSVVNSVHFKS